MTATTPAEIIRAVTGYGCRLAVRSGQLLMSRQRQLPPELLAAVRQNRQAISNAIEAEAAGLTPDCGPWLHIAKQIVLGEFDGGDRATLKSLWYGVRGIGHPACLAARARLETLLGKEART